MSKLKYGELANTFLEVYPAENDAEAAVQNRVSAVDNNNILGDFLGKARSLHGKSPTWLYFFTNTMPGPRSEKYGAFHTADVPYGFNHFSPLRADYWTQADYDLGDAMSDYFASFARTGNPNSDGRPEWSVFTEDKVQFMELGEKLAPISSSEEKVNFWNEYFLEN